MPFILNQCKIYGMKLYERYTKLINTNEGVLITDPADVFYLTGYSNPDAWILISKDGAYYMTDARYTFEAQSCIDSSYNFVNVERGLPKTAHDLIEKLGLSKVLLREDSITLRYFKLLSKDLSCHFDGADEDIRGMRSIKTAQEIEIMQKAMNIAEKALAKLFTQIEEGVTERELADRLEANMREFGSEGVAFETICVFGENTANPHGHPGDRKLQKGDAVTLDFGATYKGYKSDITRSFCYGFAPEGYAEAYDAVLNAHLAVLNNAKAGMTGKEIDALARDYLKEIDLDKYFIHSLGHGVGVEIHEEPFISIRGVNPIVDGMVITDEPGVYLDGKFGIRIEDTAVMKNGKLATLCCSDKKLIIL